MRSPFTFYIPACLTGLIFAPNLTFAAEIEEVVVTAQKREQNIQSIGLSVQALSSDEIAARGLRQSSDILDQFANVGRNAANGINAGYTIRGVGTNNFHGNVARAVSVYQDDVSINNPYGGSASVFDLERIEVLRGPQNTLFGRNAIGGAVSYISAKPVIGADLNGYLSLTAGNYGYLQAEGAMGSGLSDTLATRLAFSSTRRDGLFTNIAPNSSDAKLGEKELDAVRAQLLFEPTDSAHFLLKVHHNSHGGKSLSNKAIGLRDPNDPSQACDTQAIAAGSDFQQHVDCVTSTGFNPSSSNWHQVVDVSPASQDVDVDGATITARFEMSDVTLTSITAVEHTTLAFSEDLGAEDQLRMIAMQDTEFEQLSQEWRLTSTEESRLRWIAGIYLFDEDMRQNTNVRRVVIANGAPITPYNILTQDEKDYSAYGQFDYDLSGNTTLTLGLRYTENHKSADSLFGVVRTTEANYPSTTFIDQSIVTALTGDTPGQCPPPVGGIPCTTDLGRIRQSVDALGHNLRLTHQATENTLLYASYAHGFKSGGFDTRALAAFAGTANNPVEPEYLDAIELGAKATFNKRLRINGAIFQYTWEDLQTFDSVDGSPAFLNIPEVLIQGAEVELTWYLAHDWRIEANIGLLNSEIRDTGGLAGVDEGHELQNTPTHSSTFLVEKNIRFAQSELRLRSDVRHIAEQVDSLNNTNDPFTTKVSQTYWNVWAQYTLDKAPLSFSLWGKNLTEEKTCHQIAALTTPGTATPGDTIATLICNPSDGIRQLGAGMEYRF